MSRRTFRLTSLIPVLRQRYEGPIPGYRKLLEMAQNGFIPARQINSLWHTDEADVSAIATVLELTPLPAEQDTHRQNAA